jgi:hypothetical protein
VLVAYPQTATSAGSWLKEQPARPIETRREHVLSGEDREQLDILLGTAMVDTTVRRRLVQERDTSLLMSFALSEETQDWLCGLPAMTLVDLAQAIAYSA